VLASANRSRSSKGSDAEGSQRRPAGRNGSDGVNVDVVDEGPRRAFNIVLDPGEEAVAVLGEFARREQLETASFIAIGGFEDVDLGFYNLETKGFDQIPVDLGQVEVLSLSGEITWDDGDAPRVHGHVVVGSPDGSARGGHLLRGVVRPILIVTLEELEHATTPHH
jgi:predicted DNA-binding protein with PD1-like motif